MGNFTRFKDGKCKVYLASLQNNDLNLLKVGITQFIDAEDRFAYNYKAFTEGKEPEAYINIFPKITLCASVVVESKAKAEELEAKILKGWGNKDFWIESKLSGVTELRTYNPQRYAIAKSIINGAR